MFSARSLQLGDVPLDGRRPDDGARSVPYGRDTQRNPDPCSILSYPLRLGQFHRFTLAQLVQNEPFRIVQLLGNQPEYRLSDHLRRAVPENLLGRGVPAGDDAIQGLADDGIARGRDDRGQTSHGLLRLLLQRDVPGKAARVQEATVRPIRARIDHHVLDRTILAPQAGRVAVDDLPCQQPGQDVLDHRLVDVELRNVPADVLIALVAQHIQFCLVHPKDASILADPVQRRGGTVEKIGQGLLALAERLLGLELPLERFRGILRRHLCLGCSFLRLDRLLLGPGCLLRGVRRSCLSLRQGPAHLPLSAKACFSEPRCGEAGDRKKGHAEARHRVSQREGVSGVDIEMERHHSAQHGGQHAGAESTQHGGHKDCRIQRDKGQGVADPRPEHRPGSDADGNRSHGPNVRQPGSRRRRRVGGGGRKLVKFAHERSLNSRQ